MLQSINQPCLKMPGIPRGRRMSYGSEMFAPAVFIMVKSGSEAEPKREVRYVYANFDYSCCCVVFALWWGVGILTLAPLAPAGP